MNNATHKMLFGTPKVRRTWKVTLSPEKNSARIQQMRFCKAVAKELGNDYKVEFRFNPGGPAVWGETYVHIFTRNNAGAIPVHFQPKNMPVVEACLSVDFSYVRQWDGRNSGHNLQCHYTQKHSVRMFADNVQMLAGRPFVRF